jgi:Protein of unknown function (DUF3575)
MCILQSLRGPISIFLASASCLVASTAWAQESAKGAPAGPPPATTKPDGATSAGAQTEKAAVDSAPQPAGQAKDVPTDQATASVEKRFAIELNPLGIIMGRYSLQGEVMLASHHSLQVNPHFNYTPVSTTVNGQELDLGKFVGFGGELGYRFYSGSRGPAGFYAGASFLAAYYSQSSGAGNGSQAFGSFGGAIDIGGQAIIGPGIVIGGGFGLQYTKTTESLVTDNLNLAAAIVAGGGFRPRFLLHVGFAF